MFTHSLFLAAALLCTSFQPATVFEPGVKMVAPVGGPPRIRLATKTAGVITKLEMVRDQGHRAQGCVPDARITSLTICIMDCTGKDATATGSGGNDLYGHAHQDRQSARGHAVHREGGGYGRRATC
ncbi:MAG: hypothetical protein IPO90_09975 [Flavobacteriales bacterium]|nr:hypothetical protein [Flavobacteriales bacterium]